MRKIIIDTDPGIDDAAAIAIAMFSPELDVQLITTVSGNVSVEKTTHNALRGAGGNGGPPVFFGHFTETGPFFGKKAEMFGQS